MNQPNSLPEIKLAYQSDDLFSTYITATNNLCSYLRQHESIEAHALPEFQYHFVKERFLKFSPEVQMQKIKNFESYYELCREIVMKGRKLSDKVHCLKAFLSKYSLSIPDESEVLETIDNDTYIEVYDNKFTQVFRSADFMKVTNHGLMTLEICEWFDLFQRSKDLTSDQIEVVTKVFDGTIKLPLFKPLEDHSVKEINSEKPKVSQAEIVLYSPIIGADNLFHGILHIFKVKSTQQLDFQVVK